ncbi:Hypothetical_protein [Hexamita inflata]|uniref:Hypothetical_protein n=1 Tax=Hexamita inflata TaxID=28002 RepID=A0AA86PZ75_9EUKA|nr:Hypothetical protein HINF_LOCUS34253 [Hexamita inflata]
MPVQRQAATFQSFLLPLYQNSHLDIHQDLGTILEQQLELIGIFNTPLHLSSFYFFTKTRHSDPRYLQVSPLSLSIIDDFLICQYYLRTGERLCSVFDLV